MTLMGININDKSQPYTAQTTSTERTATNVAPH